MAKEYIIPIGVDTEKLINPLNQTISTLEKVESSAQEAGKELSNSFSASSKSMQAAEEKLKPIQKNLELVKMLGKQAGQEITAAFDGRNIDSSKLEAAAKKFAASFSNISANVDFNVDAGKLQIFEKQLATAKTEAEKLEASIRMANVVMASIDPNSDEYMQMSTAIRSAEQSLKEFSTQTENTTGRQKTLKGELRAMKAELSALEMAGETGSARFKQLSLRAGELEDQIGDTNAQIKILASDTATFDGLISGATGLVGAFTAVQGAAALFGDELS